MEAKPRNFLERGWWSFTLWWRYGSSPALAESTLGDFRRRRTALQAAVPFASLAPALRAAGLARHAATTAEQHLATCDVSTAFQREIFNPWVRARYAQNLGAISAFGALVAADNADALVVVSGGLAALWQRMAHASRASIRLRTDVLALSRGSWGGWYVSSGPSSSFPSSSPFRNERVERFDAVVLAAPWALTGAALRTNLTAAVAQAQAQAGAPVHTADVAYADQHITLFTTPDKLSAHQFHGEENIPGLVLTTPCSWEYDTVSGLTGQPGLGHAPFWVLTRLGELVVDGRRQFLYKVVSPSEMPDDAVHRLVTGNGNASSIYRYHVPSPPLLLCNGIDGTNT